MIPDIDSPEFEQWVESYQDREAEARGNFEKSMCAMIGQIEQDFLDSIDALIFGDCEETYNRQVEQIKQDYLDSIDAFISEYDGLPIEFKWVDMLKGYGEFTDILEYYQEQIEDIELLKEEERLRRIRKYEYDLFKGDDIK